MELGTEKKTNPDYFQPLSDPHIPNCIGDSISIEEGEAEDVELAEDQTLDEMNIDNEIEDGNENEILQDNSERIKIANEKLDDVLESIREPSLGFGRLDPNWWGSLFGRWRPGGNRGEVEWQLGVKQKPPFFDLTIQFCLIE